MSLNLFQSRDFIENRLHHRCFPVKLAKALITPFLQNTSVLLVLFLRKVKFPEHLTENLIRG